MGSELLRFVNETKYLGLLSVTGINMIKTYSYKLGLYSNRQLHMFIHCNIDVKIGSFN